MKADPLRFFWGIAGSLIIFGAIWLGWSIGSKPEGVPGPVEDHRDAAGQMFRVSGGSMVPTLYGPSLRTTCPGCGQPFLFDPQSLQRLDQDLICTLCGHRQPMSELREGRELSTYPGDVVQVVQAQDVDHSIGQLVAVRWQGKTHVKRVAAVEGDEVDVSGRRLLVNGRRLEDWLAHNSGGSWQQDLVVDDDSRRQPSRWASSPGDASWLRDGQRRGPAQQTQLRPGWFIIIGTSTTIIVQRRS